MHTSKKLIVLVDYDISTLMTDFYILFSLRLLQKAKSSLNAPSTFFQIKNTSSITLSHIKGLFTVFCGSHSEVMFQTDL